MKYLIMTLFALVAMLGCTQQELNAGERVVQQRVRSESAEFRVVQVMDGLQHPWGMAFLPDGGILVTERTGNLLLIEGTESRRVTGLPEIASVGQGGLLDIAVHPQFKDNRLVYFSFASSGEGGVGTALARGRLEGTSLRNTSVIFTMNRLSGGRVHFGSRIMFLDDGTLLLTVGDRGEADRAQNLADHAGSTLRLRDDGSVPQDNPFVGRSGVAPEIYTYGNRNAQGMDIHPETREVWQSEHGPRGGDELNLIQAGNNYGWPVISHGLDYRTGQQIGQGQTHPEMEGPIEHWSPAIAPSGMSFYTGSAFPGWQGDLFIASLVARHLRRVRLAGHEVVHQEVLLQDTLGRIRDIRQGTDGHIYLLTDAANGGLFRIEPAE